MKKQTLVLLGLVILLITSCNSGEKKSENQNESSPQQQREELFQAVIAVHDEVMPKMQDVMNLKGKLNTRIDSLMEVDSTLEEIGNLRELEVKLSDADKAMMTWMREFNPDMKKEEVPQDEALAYLNAEMEKIKEVKAEMNSTIEEAKIILQK